VRPHNGEAACAGLLQKAEFPATAPTRSLKAAFEFYNGSRCFAALSERHGQASHSCCLSGPCCLQCARLAGSDTLATPRRADGEGRVFLLSDQLAVGFGQLSSFYMATKQACRVQVSGPFPIGTFCLALLMKGIWPLPYLCPDMATQPAPRISLARSPRTPFWP
jgi:hypothetical protein